MIVRPALLAAAALAIALGATLALCRWGAGGNQSLFTLARAVQHGEELDPYLEAALRRDAARRALAGEVVAGRLTLREAAEQFRRLDEANPGYPAGAPRPSGDERLLAERVLDFVWVVVTSHQQYAAAARFYSVTFTAHPDLLTDSPYPHRYRAACAAARAGCGVGRDAAELDEASRAGFRRQALDWLWAELDSWRRLLEKQPGNAWLVARDLRDWLADSHFVGVRGPDALARLPEAERQAWQQLWADVADTLARAQGTRPPEPKAGSKMAAEEPRALEQGKRGLAVPRPARPVFRHLEGHPPPAYFYSLASPRPPAHPPVHLSALLNISSRCRQRKASGVNSRKKSSSRQPIICRPSRRRVMLIGGGRALRSKTSLCGKNASVFRVSLLTRISQYFVPAFSLASSACWIQPCQLAREGCFLISPSNKSCTLSRL
jgi:hypothetical protein